MNEVVCYAQNYSLEKLVPFVKSLRENVGFSDKTKLTIIYKDILIPHQDHEEDHSYFESKELDKKYNVDVTLSPYTLKVIYFYLYCKSISKAENVFLCDCTDVFFNKDPFEIVKDKVSLFVENETINKCPVNSQWLRGCYNQDVLNLIGKKSILNGGLILGNRLQCIELLKEMIDDMIGIIGRVGNYLNIDQAALNKVVYFDELNYNVSSNGDMVNCAHLNNQNPKVEFVNNQIKVNNKIPYVVHQYPCIKSLEVKW